MTIGKLSAAACTLAFILGCSASEDSRLPTEKVKVKIVYKDKPIEGATVTFMLPPTGGEAPPPAFGQTNAEGIANLSTYGGEDGAVIGKHMVLIAKQEFTNQKEAASQDSADYNPGASPVPVTKHLLPRKYALPSSGLTSDVAKGKPVDVTFELKD